MDRLRALSLAAVLALLAACGTGTRPAADAATLPAADTSPSGDAAETVTPVSQPSHPAADAPAPPQQVSPASSPAKVRTGGPLPPQVLPAPVRIDRSCHSDGDCAVKDIGNCCGRFPACVNRDSPTDPAAVQAQCAREGKASSCGFQEIHDCACREGTCVARDALDVR